MPDAEKRRRADWVVRTGLSRHHALRAIRRLIGELRRRPPQPDRKPWTVPS
jgi:dephospho-CoA kinase